MTSKYKEKDERYFERLYSSKMRINRRVLKMERATDETLSALFSREKSLFNQVLQSNLEWLLTWKLKNRHLPQYMWCDGVSLKEVVRLSKSTISLIGLVRVGPEGSEKIFNVPLVGTMVLKHTGKQFKRYCFTISYHESSITVKKT